MQYSKYVCLVMFLVTPQLPGQYQQKKYTVDLQEVIDLTNQLFQACNPSNPENDYFPPLVKEKVSWLYREREAGRLIIGTTKDEDNYMGTTLMMSSYDPQGLPRIDLSLKRLIVWIRLEGKTPSGFSRTQKNSFALSLTHEAVHFEAPRSLFIKKIPQPQVIREELRTYRRVNMAVAELLRKNEPVDFDFLEVRKALATCGRQIACPAFNEYYLKAHNYAPSK